MTLRAFEGIYPTVAESVYIDESALVIGHVSIGADSSIWPMTVVRGDVNRITIGCTTNIQDGSVLHVTHPHSAHPSGFELYVGNNVTVGHRVVLHGCHIDDNCLIGMGSTIMDDAVVHSHVLIGAGSLVSPGKELESGFLYVGAPVRKLRRLSQDEYQWIDYSASHYQKLKNRHQQR